MITDLLEIVISAIVLLAITVSSIRLFWQIGFFNGNILTISQFDDFLSSALGLVIGVEFIKMLVKHTPGAAVEVLLYAIARELIVTHTSTFETLIGIVAIAAVFAIRKYLFIGSFERTDRYLFLASAKLRNIRLLSFRRVPVDPDLTLGEFMKYELELQGKKAEKDVSVSFQGFLFRIVSLKDDEISTVEIIPDHD